VQVLVNIIYYTFPLVKIKSVLKKYQIFLAYMYMDYLFVNTDNIYYIYIHIHVHMLYDFFQDTKI